MLSPELKTIDTQVQTSFSSLEEELKKLREDKEILEGKIRGYLTLSEICHEYKEELRKLQAEYDKLLHKEQMKAKHLYSESPASDNDADRNDRPDLEHRTTPKPTHPSNTALPNTEIATEQRQDSDIATQQRRDSEIVTELIRDRQIRTGELFDPGVTHTPVAPADHHNDLNRTTMTSSSVSVISGPGKTGQSSLTNTEKYPMQESIADESALALVQPGPGGSSHPSRSLTGLGFHPSSSGEMALGQSAANYKPGDKMDLMDFSLTPSLNAKEINQRAGNAELETVITSIREDLSDVSVGEKVVSTVKNFTDQVHCQLNRQSKANHILIDKNTELKKKLQMTEQDYQLVLARVKKLEQEKYEVSPSRSRSPDDATGWVHVQKLTQGESQQAAELSDEEARKLEQLQLHPDEKIDDLKWLQTHYRQLREANQRWSAEWDKLKFHYDQRVKEIEDERDRLEKTLTDKKLLEETRQRDFERVSSQLRERVSEEEKAKEEALLQLTTCNNRLETMQRQIAELSDKTHQLRREKQAKESEIQVLRQGLGSRPAAATSPTGSGRGKSVEELQTENAVLHQQLVVFQEDFERERQDRATAQSLKDDYKKQNSEYKKRVRHAEQKLANWEKQCKQAEDTSRRTLAENERLQQELTDLKNQQRRREEELSRTMLAPAPAPGGYLPHPQPQHQQLMQSAGLQHAPSQPVYAGAQPAMYPAYMQRQQQQPYTQLQVQQFPAVGQYIPAGSASQAAVGPAPPPATQYTQASQAPAPQLAGTQPQQQQASPRPAQQGGGGRQAAGGATEHLPGSWSCNQCTYVNYPGRTVCEMCGYIQSPTIQNNFRFPATGSDILMPRGEENQQQQPPGYQYNYTSPGQNVGPTRGNPAV